MSVKTIFSGSLPDVDYKLVMSLNGTSCLALSQVSKYAQQVLSNDFFKAHFFLHYPHFKITEKKLFEVLAKNYSNSCWKIACDSFCFIKSSNSKNQSAKMFLQLSREFFKSQMPRLHTLWKSQHSQCLPQIQTIIQINGWQDELSPLHVLYKSFVNCSALGVFEEMAAICDDKAVVLGIQRLMAPIEENKKMGVSIDQLGSVSTLGRQFDQLTNHLPLLEKFIAHPEEEANNDWVIPFAQHAADIELDFYHSLKEEPRLTKRAELENCLINIIKAVKDNSSGDILNAILSLEKEEEKAVFPGFVDDEAAKKALLTEAGRAAFLKKYEPALKQRMDYHYEAKP